MQLKLQNVRSFCRVHPVTIKPLTILVGENSTGKTTFLSMLAHVNQPDFPSVRPSFNTPPFDLGSYDSIATYKGGSFGRADEFSVSISTVQNGNEQAIEVSYQNYRGQPLAREVTAQSDMGEVHVRITPEGHAAHVSLKLKGSEGTSEFDTDLKPLGAPETDIPLLYVTRMSPRDLEKAGIAARQFYELTLLLRWRSSPVLALAPVRTQPRRTYDKFSEDFDPEGDHVPVLLARLWRDEAESEKNRLLEALDEFGESSGLYKRISIRNLGRKPSDPFQILVTMAGPPVNISDVGYGVSQALPVIVQSVLANKRGLLLLQQPEVHLHPRAQAALGTFFSSLVAAEKKQIVVETHSDYLIDRVRQEVAHGNLTPDSVQILFFEKQGIETQIHEIGLDDKGNVVGAPSSYRRFFLEEEENLFLRANR